MKCLSREVIHNTVGAEYCDKAIGWLLSQKEDGNITNIKCKLTNGVFEAAYAAGDIYTIYSFRYGILYFIAKDKNNKLYFIQTNPHINDPERVIIREFVFCPVDFGLMDRFICHKFRMPHGTKFEPSVLKEVLGLSPTDDKYYICG